MVYNNSFKNFSSIFLLGIVLIVNSCKQLPVTTQFPKQAEKTETVEEIVKEPIVAKIDDTELTESDLEAITNRYIINDSTDLNAITKEIVFQQLVFKEAKRLNYGQDSVMLNELETYKKIIYEDFQEDSTIINELAFEAYNHLQNEVEVAHILFYCSEHASPQFTVSKKLEAEAVLERLENGESFESLAKQYSDDPATAQKGGYMGWYTGLQLLYPLEVAAFNLKVGDISKPVASKYGFHLVKLLNKRSSRGRVKVKHLLRVVPENNIDMKDLQKAKIDSIRNLAMAGVSFDSLVYTYSDDFRTRDSGGLLPEFWIGSREEKVVEEAVFKLKENEISEPIYSSAGWHLFKLIEKNPIPNWRSLRPEIISKVTTDSRGEFIEDRWVEATKKALKFTPNFSIINAAVALGNQNLLSGNWTAPDQISISESFLFAINGESISVKRFLEYVETFQLNANLPKNYSPDMAMRFFYERFETNILKEYGKKNLELVNPSFRNALQTYYESLVTKNYLNDFIYGKSMRDSVGLQNYYRKTIQNYQFPERARIIQLTSQNLKAIELIENQLAAGKPYNLNRGIAPTFFVKNSTLLSQAETEKLNKLIIFLKRNPQYIVEIGGHADTNEDSIISSERIKTVTQFLINGGLPLTRIKENDFGKTQQADRFDWQKNQRITFRFFSTSITDLERIVKNQGFDVEISDRIISKSELLEEFEIEWKIGSYEVRTDNEYINKIFIDEIYPARSKTFREARVSVINGYQAELEEKLYNDLLKKYPVELNQNLLNGIYNKKLSTNK